MIHFDRFVLDNGLRVLVHEDSSSPMAVVNVMYDIGSRDEDPDRTGFAHLFEHLMFGGSINIPQYDEPLQRAGGENNAYTTSDLTNYYCQLPAENIETAFWLESDRMMSLAFSENSLQVQRKVVSEEFKEHYINQPYGDAWHKMRELAYQVHPYRWMTIGKELSHIENAKLQDVEDFFFRYYRPNNAILVVAGNVKTEEIKTLVHKWFSDIPAGSKPERKLPVEPEQTELHELDLTADVPLDAFYETWHMPSRLDKGYYAAELITEILGGGGSSRLFHRLVKQEKIFSNINCYQFGTIDAGLLTIEGKLVKGVKLHEAEAAVEKILEELKTNYVSVDELQKVKNKTESQIAFEDMSLMNRAANLAFYELLGNASLFNEEMERYAEITAEDILYYSNKIFRKTNSNILRYHSKALS